MAENINFEDYVVLTDSESLKWPTGNDPDELIYTVLSDLESSGQGKRLENVSVEVEFPEDTAGINGAYKASLDNVMNDSRFPDYASFFRANIDGNNGYSIEFIKNHGDGGNEILFSPQHDWSRLEHYLTNTCPETLGKEAASGLAREIVSEHGETSTYTVAVRGKYGRSYTEAKVEATSPEEAAKKVDLGAPADISVKRFEE